MNSPDILTFLSKFHFFDKLLEKIKSTRVSKDKILISPLYGSAYSFLISELCKTENHIVVLTPNDKLASELSTELEYLDIISRKILLTDFKAELLQEKLTEISNNQNYILISTYQLLT
ncbi:MAG: hypothetical protein P8X73_11025, partial [Ignavibacteriaceae bacterium]